MVDEEHAVARHVLVDDDVALLEHLVLQLGQDGAEEVVGGVLEQRRFSQQPAAHDRQDLLEEEKK